MGEKGSITFEGSEGVPPPCLKTVMVISIGCLPGQKRIGKWPEIKPAMDWVLAFPIMGTVWLPQAAGRCCLHAPPSSQLSLIHRQVSFIISWGLRCGEVTVFGSGPGYQGRKKGYLERSGQELQIGLGD